MSRRWLRLASAAYLALGVGLLAWVLAEVDLEESASQVAAAGVAGVAVVSAIYLFAFLLDCLSWQLALPALPMTARWTWRLFRVRMVGEVFNAVLPAGGMGGEPLKAALLRRHHGLGYGESVASLILARTINLIAQVVFLAAGFAFVIATDLPDSVRWPAMVGLVGLALAVALLFLVQQQRASSRGLGRLAARLGGRGARLLAVVEQMDARLAGFYDGHRDRFGAALLLAFVNWMAGAAEVWVTLVFIGQPVSFAEAWVIEAMAQLVRTAAFFVPVALGVQEGILVLVCGAIIGQPALGLSVAIVRRVRELLWLLWGTLIGARLSLVARRQRDV